MARLELLRTPVPHAQVSPRGALEHLSQRELELLESRGTGGLHPLFRQCALAVLASGIEIDDAKLLFDTFKDFDIGIDREPFGVRLELKNAPASAFVDGKMIEGVREHLFSVLRDIVYVTTEVEAGRLELSSPAAITDAVFAILRNGGIFRSRMPTNLVVCWGGHSIAREEYVYTKRVGYELGLRGLDVATGCGPGAMKGPMKGAAIGHAKQRLTSGRYVGITEPGIIAAEPPNPIVNQLVILPDIEKRLEAFVRAGHGFVIFPGGVGTTEEILYLLGILLEPENEDHPMPVIFTGPESSRSYFDRIDRFIGTTLGSAALRRYRIIYDDPEAVARTMIAGADEVRAHRSRTEDAYAYNWRLRIPEGFQKTFEPTHENMAGLELRLDQPVHERAVNLRRAFSGLVAGNVKDAGIRAVEERGPFQLRADRGLVDGIEELLASFAAEQRMKLEGEYRACYTLVER
jgi:pyrimidine/purine-5'-nucleotide nucleosidase